MSIFTTPVVRVLSVEDHPNADRLSIVKVLGYTCISGKIDKEGNQLHRYKVGDLVVYIPSASLLPEWLLKEMDFWDKEKNIGGLSGPDGNRVKPMRLRGIYSEGVLYNTESWKYPDWPENIVARPHPTGSWNWKTTVDSNGTKHHIMEGDDVSEFLGITKYEPPIPTSMSGMVANMFGHTIKYDFERLESQPDMFDDGEMVIATEKLHGTFCAIVFVPNLNHPEMFGSNGEILVHSKGLGAQGLAFKNVLENDNNVYVKTLNRLLENGLENKLKSFLSDLDERSDNVRFSELPVVILGEVFGRGVQDLHYGFDTPTFRIFDIRLGDTWQSYNLAEIIAEIIGCEMVPKLYDGPFDKIVLETHRDGKTALGGGNIREGIVVRSLDEKVHSTHGRKIAKMISPAYLLRKAKDATEFT